MSRSYKKTPAWSCACYFSNKIDKKLANRALRHKNKQIIRNCGKEKQLVSDIFDWEWCDYLPINEKMKFPNLDWYWEFSVSVLCNADFKTLREVSDVWDFASDGLAYYHGEPDWRESEKFQNDTKEEFMEKVRDRTLVKRFPFFEDSESTMFNEYYAKWCYYRWKMK